MPFQYPRSGLSNTNEYLASGLPWITSSWAMSASWMRIDFPHVTSHVYLRNNGPGYLKYGFTKNGLYIGNYGRLEPSGTIDYNIRCKTMYFLGSTVNTEFQITAGLTTILWEHFPTLTGSAVWPSGSHNTGIWEYGYGISGSMNSGSGL